MKNRDALTVKETVLLSREEAFKAFVHQFSSWYPADYTWSGKKLESIELGTSESAFCTEWGPHKFRLDWGRVVKYRSPEQVVFTWQISYNRQPVPDPARASEVDVRFVSSAEGTLVVLEHSKFSRHEEHTSQYRNAMASPEGWPFILSRFKAFCKSTIKS